MNVEIEKINESKNYPSFDCFCLRRVFCSPNRVVPSNPTIQIVEIKGGKNQPFDNFSPLDARLENLPIEDTKFRSNMTRKREERSKTPAQLQSLSPSRPGSVQQSRSSHAIVSPVELENVNRPFTRVMNRNPTVEDIARLPHATPNKSQSDLNLSTQGREGKNPRFRIGGKVLLPPLPVLRKGAGDAAKGDAAKRDAAKQTRKTKSKFRGKNDLQKEGDDGSGEQVISFSLPAITPMDSLGSEWHNQNQVVKKGGIAYDLLPSNNFLLPELHKRNFVKSPRSHLAKTNLEPEKDLKQKLERAERRRLARQEEVRQQSRQRHLQFSMNQQLRNQANDKAHNLEAKLQKAAEKRREQLTNRQTASRKRLERVQRQRRTSAGSLDQIETEDMTQEDIWNFLVTRGDDEDAKDVPWWEKNKASKDKLRPIDEGERSNSKIPRSNSLGSNSKIPRFKYN